MNELFEKLRTSKKYRDVCPDTIIRVISECEGRYKKTKDLEKAVREKLHGITSAFMTDVEYKKALSFADEWMQANESARCIKNASFEALLSCHASTRERLPLSELDALYRRIFEATESPTSVLDLACGINPLYLLDRYPNLHVCGVDVSGQSVNIIRHCGGSAHLGDLLCPNAIPNDRFDAALLFKILPLLDRQRSGAVSEIMNAINAKYLVVSFPTRTLGGRNVGMEENYSLWMENHLPENRSITAKFTSDNELFYILKESSFVTP